MADTHNQAEVKKRYPVTSGLDADSKHEGRQSNLVPTGIVHDTTPHKTNIRKAFRKGL